MQFSKSTNTSRWIIIVTSFVIVVLILWNTFSFFQIFKNEERIKMQVLAESLKTINKANLETDDIDLPLQIISYNTTIPVIVIQNEKINNTTNIDEAITSNPKRMAGFLNQLKAQNDPIKIEYAPNKFQFLYYGDSALITKLKYYPIALLLIIFLFGMVVYNFYQSTKIATQNKLWAGMAKETAHQIGTPLSSLIGWLEIMKADNVDATTVAEIEKDVVRLQTIANRFSKIGSEPSLQSLDVVAQTKQSFEYLKARFSNQIEFDFSAPNHAVYILINPELHSWTIENLMKNAIDAMKGRGKLKIEMVDEVKYIKINAIDTGKGIPKKQFNLIFEPGFTTKKRGWGLGLSLSKRIVEEYHKGKIKVLHSEIGVGTTIQMAFKK